MKMLNRSVAAGAACTLALMLWSVGGHGAGGGVPAHAAQDLPTATPTATATATPSAPPSADQLLAAEEQASKDKDTVHVVGTSRMVIQKVDRQDATLTGDESIQKGQIKLTATTHDTKLNGTPRKTTTTHGTIVLVGSTMATRSRKKAWKCTDVQSLVSGLDQLGSTIPAGLDAQSSNVGAETLSGIAVWHVRTTISVPGLTPSGHPLTLDDYINQADNTLVRHISKTSIVMSLKVKGKKTTVHSQSTSTTDYSRYGEPVSITLPAACTKSALRPAQAADFPLLLGGSERSSTIAAVHHLLAATRNAETTAR